MFFFSLHQLLLASGIHCPLLSVWAKTCVLFVYERLCMFVSSVICMGGVSVSVSVYIWPSTISTVSQCVLLSRQSSSLPARPLRFLRHPHAIPCAVNVSLLVHCSCRSSTTTMLIFFLFYVPKAMFWEIAIGPHNNILYTYCI